VRAIVNSLLILLVLSVCPVHPGICGQLEDGIAAYDHQDYQTALKSFLLLADQGDAKGELYLGLMYEDGHGVPKSHADAMRLFRKSAGARKHYRYVQHFIFVQARHGCEAGLT